MPISRLLRPKRLVALGVAAALVSSLAACASSSSAGSSDSSSKGPIIIGGALALSGSFSTYDTEPLNSAKLFIKKVNASGGIDGRKVKLVTSDIASDPTKGPTAAKAVIAEGAQIVLVSCDFDMGSPAAVTAISAGKLVMSVCAGSDKFGPSGLGDLAFTIGTPYTTEAAATAQFTVDKGYKNVYVLTDSSTQYNVSYGEAYEATLKHLGGKVDGTGDFKATDTTIATQLAKLKAQAVQPDAIMIGTNLPGGASAVREIRSAGINIPIIANSGLDGQSWLPQVPGLKDFYFDNYASTLGDDSNKTVNEITDEWKTTYGHAPTTSFAYMGWALMQVLQAGIEKSHSTDGATLAKSLETLKKFPTVVGPTTYTSTSHIPSDRSINMNQDVDGKTSFIKKVVPSFVPAAQ